MRRALVAAAVVGALAATAGCGDRHDGASPTTSPKAAATLPVRLNPGRECGRPAVRPQAITLTCADGGVQLQALRWRSWGEPVAEAEGIISVHGCDQSCAQDNRTFTYSVTVSAHQPVTCPDGSRQYAFIDYTVNDDRYDNNRPDDGTRGFDCPTAR